MEDKIAQAVYDRLLGHLALQRSGFDVEDLFAEGAPGDRLYEQIYQANLRLCEKLGVQEDADLQSIIDNFWMITALVGEKMYQYGRSH